MRFWPTGIYQHLFGLGCVVLATAARYALDHVFPGLVPFATFFPAVVAAGFFGGLGACITATTVSILAAWYFFLPPLQSFAPPSVANALNLFLFAVAAGITGAVGAMLRKKIIIAHRADARLRRGQMAGGVADWEWDIDANRTFWSDSFFHLLGRAPGSAPPSAATLYEAMHVDDRERMHAIVGEAAKNMGRFETEFRIVHPDGSTHWLSTRGEAKRDVDGVRRMTGVVIDISKLKEAERLRELMFHELNHRVKNNFQIVSSLLRLQAGQTRDPAAQLHLNDAMQRVMTIADIHGALYQSGHIDTLDLGQYLVGLCRKLQQSLLGKAPIKFDIQVVPAIFKVDRAIPLGLVANELITNAIKHAFPDGRKGQIQVRLARSNGGYVLTVADDGVGLPENSADKGGLGSRLIEGFIGQADGKMIVSTAGGTRVEIELPDNPNSGVSTSA